MPNPLQLISGLNQSQYTSQSRIDLRRLRLGGQSKPALLKASILILTIIVFSASLFGQRKSRFERQDELGIYVGLNTLLFRHHSDHSTLRSDPKLIPAIAFGAVYRHRLSKRLSHMYQLSYRTDRLEFDAYHIRRDDLNGVEVIARTEEGITTLNSSTISMTYAFGLTLIRKINLNIYTGLSLGGLVRFKSFRQVDVIEYGKRMQVAGQSVFVLHDEPIIRFDQELDEFSSQEFSTEIPWRVDVSLPLKHNMVLTPAIEYYLEMTGHNDPTRNRIVTSIMLTRTL